MRGVLLLLSAIAAQLLAACDASPSGRRAGVENNTIATTPEEKSSRTAPESIVRQDVLEETTVPEEPRIEPVELTLDFSQANGELPKAATEALDKLLKQPIMSTPSCVAVRGHTDSRGSDEQNLGVSERRANLVRDYLVQHGVDEQRITVIALGERRPAAPNANLDGSDNPAGRARNRRVAIQVEPTSTGLCAAKDGERESHLMPSETASSSH